MPRRSPLPHPGLGVIIQWCECCTPGPVRPRGAHKRVFRWFLHLGRRMAAAVGDIGWPAPNPGVPTATLIGG
nr:MAG TPA: hypothetical protein [Caudoviricetes sp.]